MARIDLSAQPLKTTVSRSNISAQVFVITTRCIPEHPDANRNILCSSVMVNVGATFRRFPDKPLHNTPWGRLLYQCRRAREYNHECIAEALAAIRWRGFDAVESV